MRDNASDPFAAWKSGLVKNAKTKIRELRADGVVSMSRDNFAMVLKAPPGGPVGPSAPYFWRNSWVPSAIANLPISYRRFIINENANN
jgi:hypothetical protein